MRLTIKLKLGVAFGVVIALAAGAAGLGISSLGSLNQTMVGMVNGPVLKLQWSEEEMIDLVEVVRAEKNLILSTTPEQIEKYDQQILALRQQFETLFDKIHAIVSVEARPKWTVLHGTWEQFLAVDDKIRDFGKHGEQAKAQELSTGPGRQLVGDAQKQLSDLVAVYRRQTGDAQAEAAAEYERSRTILLSGVAAALLIGISTAVWLSLTISRGLGRAKFLADAVALGDLDQQIERRTNDEIKDLVDALNKMSTNLRNTAKVADTIADGDLTVVTTLLSEKDSLGLALERMLVKLREVVGEAMGASENVSSGSQELSASARAVVAGRDRAGFGGRRGFGLDGTDGGQHQAERRQRQPDREDRPPVGQRRADQRRGGDPCGDGDADDRREDHHRAGDRPADRSAGAECRG